MTSRSIPASTVMIYEAYDRHLPLLISARDSDIEERISREYNSSPHRCRCMLQVSRGWSRSVNWILLVRVRAATSSFHTLWTRMTLSECGAEWRGYNSFGLWPTLQKKQMIYERCIAAATSSASRTWKLKDEKQQYKKNKYIYEL